MILHECITAITAQKMKIFIKSRISSVNVIKDIRINQKQTTQKNCEFGLVKTFIFCAVHNRANKRLTYLTSSTLSFFIFHLFRELFMSIVLQRCAGCPIL